MATPQPVIDAMEHYCACVRIWNPVKARYASAYAEFLIHGTTKPDNPADLSAMDAQGVRLDLWDIYYGPIRRWLVQ